MALILACAPGLKAVQPAQARQVASERQARLLSPHNPPFGIPGAEAELLAMLGDPDPAIRHRAAGALASIGSTAPELVGPLLELLESRTEEVAWATRRSPNPDPARALVRYQFPLPAIAPRLVPALAHPDRYVRSAALTVLADAAERPGPGAAPGPALVPLLGALADADPHNRLRAAEILARLDPGSRLLAVTVLVGQLRDPPDRWSLLATVSLSRFDPEGAAAAPILADRLGAGDLRTRLDHLELLGRLGPLARSAVPAIVRAMTAPDAQEYPKFGTGQMGSGPGPIGWINIGVYETGFPKPQVETLGSMGAAVLGQLGPGAEGEAVASLVAVLKEGDRARRLAAVDALGDLGRAAGAAFPTLLARAEVPRPAGPPRPSRLYDWHERRLCLALAQVVAADDPRLVAALIRMVDGDDPTRRAAATEVLSKLDPPPVAAVPALVGALRAEPQAARVSAALALGRYPGAQHAVAIPALVAALTDPDVFVRYQAARSLARLGAGAAAAVPVLVDLLDERYPAYRSGAAETLGKYGPAARAALPALEARRADPDKFLCEAVAKAIPLIDPPAGQPPAAPESASPTSP